MSLINEQVIAQVNSLLSHTRIKIQALPPAARQPDGFFAIGLPIGNQIITMPEWYVEDWHKGFGGWVCTSGATVRYVRHRLSHIGLFDAMSSVLAAAAPDERGRRRDMRTPEVEAWIKDDLLPQEGFYFQDLWEQLSEVIAASMLKIGEGRTNESKHKGVNTVRRAVSEFMNSFQPVRSRIEDENTNLVKFLQFTCQMGYPETGLPGGVSGFFRNAFVNHMVYATKEHGGLINVWGEGPFKAIVSCTGKTMAGEWVTLVPPVTLRLNEANEMVERTDLKTPLMIAATCPIGFNAKRHYRETNAVSRSQELYEPIPIKYGMSNGYEHYLGKDLDARQTEVCICVGGLIGINLYRDPNNPGEWLNLDDIIMTPQGRLRMRAKYRHTWELDAEEWKTRQLQFLEEDGKTPKEGYSLEPSMVRATSVDGNDLFSAEMKIKGPVKPDPDIVGKVFVQGLKAMAKSIISRLVGVDKRGNEFEIDLVVSGHSIKEKKMPFIPLMAMASRAGIRYCEDFENPISPLRQQRQSHEDYTKWACAQNDLVRATYLALLSQGESPDGLVDVYSITDTLNGDVPKREFVGRGVVGWTRASRLYESERTGTKAKKRDGMPYGTYIRILANQQIKRDPEVLRQFNMAAEIHRALIQFKDIGNGENEWTGPEMELV